MSDKLESKRGINERATTEVAPSVNGQGLIDLSTNIDITESSSINATIDECDHSKQTGIVIMISFNHFGFMKSNYLMQTTLDIMKKLQKKGITIQLIIDDLTPKINEPSTFKKKDWVLTSMIRKLGFNTFSSVHSWEMNIFSFIFVDNSTDFTDPGLIDELRRVTFHGIKLYLISIGDGVDMSVINKYLIIPEQIISIESYHHLNSSLLPKLAKKLCVRQTKPNIDIA